MRAFAVAFRILLLVPIRVKKIQTTRTGIHFKISDEHSVLFICETPGVLYTTDH